MRLFGYDINITKATPNVPGNTPTLLPPYSGYGGWFNVIRESFPGAWQRNVELRLDNVMTYSALYACVTLISQDIGKLCIDLLQKDGDDIWSEVENPSFSPVLRKPNHFQTRQKFIEQWIASKLMHGNTYVLKERDQRNVVTRMYVMDPQVTRVLIAPDGEVFYQLGTNRLAGIDTLIGVEQTQQQATAPGVDISEVTQGVLYVPASEIIHDVYVPFYHPLVGVSPISACGLAAVQGLAMQDNSTKFFQNNSNPGGVLIAPGTISEANARELKNYWEQNFMGNNAGRIAVLSDGLKFEPMTITPTDAQLINQLRWTNETVCTAFKVPGFKIGVGPLPTNQNVEAINLQYYQQCLQPLMESVEALLDDGLGLLSANQQLSVAFDLDDLLKMDTNTQVRTYGEGVARGIMAPNEARALLGYGPVDGGDTPYMQQQQFSLAALNERDSNKPFAKPAPAPSATPAAKPPPTDNQNPPPNIPPVEAMLHESEWHAALKTAVSHARII